MLKRDASVLLLAWNYDGIGWVTERTILLPLLLLALKAEGISPMACLTCNYPLFCSCAFKFSFLLFSLQSPSAWNHCYLRRREEDFSYLSVLLEMESISSFFIIFIFSTASHDKKPELSFYGHTESIIFFV